MMSHDKVTKSSCRELKNGRTKIHDEQRSRSSSIVTDKFVGKTQMAPYEGAKSATLCNLHKYEGVL